MKTSPKFEAVNGEIVSLEEKADEIDPPVADHVPFEVHERILKMMDEREDFSRVVPQGFSMEEWIQLHGSEYTAEYERLNRDHQRSLHEQAVDSFIYSYLQGDQPPDLLAKGVFYRSDNIPGEDLDEFRLQGHLSRDSWLGGETDVMAVFVDEEIVELIEVKSSSSAAEYDGNGDDQLENAEELLDECLEVKTHSCTVSEGFRRNTRFPPFYDGNVEWNENYLESEVREFLDSNYFHIVPSYGGENEIMRRL